MGGLIALLFSIYLGPAFSPMMTGHGGGTYWFTLIIMPNVIVIIGGVFVKVTRAGGSILMWIGGIASIIGYGVSPASLFGILFIYGGFKGLGEPIKSNEVST